MLNWIGTYIYLKRSIKCGVDYRDVIPNTNISAYIACLTTPTLQQANLIA
jgi:hypothetical protein